MPMHANGARLVVAWTRPDRLRDDDVVLSFLPPADEDGLKGIVANQVVSARSLARSGRAAAVDGVDAEVMAIDAWAANHGVAALTTWGAPRPVLDALRRKFHVRAMGRSTQR